MSVQIRSRQRFGEHDRSDGGSDTAIRERLLQMHAAPRVGADDHRRTGPGCGAFDGCHLAVADLAGQLGLQRRVRAAGPAAHPSSSSSTTSATSRTTERTGRCAFWTWRRWHGSCTITGASSRRNAGSASSTRRDPLVHVEHSRREPAGAVGVEQMPVVLQCRAASRRVDEDRGVAGHRRHDVAAPASRPRREARRGCAAHHSMTPFVRDVVGDSERIQHACRVAVGLAQPGVHHAAGEQPHVRAGGRDRRSAPEREAPHADTARRQSQPLRKRQRRRPSQQRTVAWQASRRQARCHRGVIVRSRANSSRVPSIRRPNGTPLGQAGSQPRHCTHVSMISTKSSSIGAPRHCTARIASIRPRGERASSPVARNVGQ